MSNQKKELRSKAPSTEQYEELQRRLAEAEQALEAIRQGDVDALVVAGPRGEQVFSLGGAEHIYRVIVETMNEAALTVDPDGTILFCNQRFCDLLQTPIQQVMGRQVTAFVAGAEQLPLKTLLAEAQAGPVQRRLTLWAATGAVVPVQLAASRLEVSGSISICLVATDLTELEKQTEEVRVQREELAATNTALREARDELEVRVQERTAQLRESEYLRRLAQEVTRVGTFEWNIVTDVNTWTPELEALYGLPPGGFAGTYTAWEQLVHPEDRARAVAAVQRAFETSETVEDEWRVIWPDGSIHWLAGRFRILRDEAGQPRTLTGVNIDITDRKHAEETLRKSEEQHRFLFENMLDGYAYCRMVYENGKPQDFIYLDVNPSFETLTGLKDVVGKKVSEVIPGIQKSNPEVFEVYGRVALTGQPERFETYVEPVKTWFSVSVYSPQREQFVSVFDNITQRKQAEAELVQHREHLEELVQERTSQLARANVRLQEQREALRENEQRLRLAAEAAQLGVFEWNVQADVAIWENRRMYEIFGVPLDSQSVSLGRLVREVLHPDDRARFETQLAESMQSGTLFRGTYRIRRWNNGQWRWIEYFAQCELTPEGKPIRLLGVLEDITERKQAEEALRQSERQFKSTFENAAVGIAHVALDGHFLQFNSRFCEIAGYLPDDILGRTCEEITFADDWKAEQVQMQRLLDGQVDHYLIEKRYRRKDGSSVWVNLTRSVQSDEAGEPEYFITLVEDISERKRAEEALHELTATLESKVAQRTEELRYRARQLQKLMLDMSETEDRERKRMAEILHDDLQQQLAGAKFHLGLMRNRAKHDSSLQAIGAQVDHMLKDAIDKSRNLSHELSPAVLHHADFAETLRWLAHEVQARHGLLVRVRARDKIHPQSDALKGFLYKAAQELLFNIVKHAGVNEAEIRVRQCHRYICLSISDRGRGFNPQALREATGYGLLSIREQIDLLGGRMKIKSAKGQGSTFHIVVPQGEIAGTDAQVKTKPNGRTKAAAGDKDRLRVLLADDHEIVREGLRSLLSDEHDVAIVGEAANGREAVDLATRLQPDVIIMDLSMPVIEGDEATRQIKACLPQTRVIAISMYDQAEKIDAMYRAGAESYVLKTAPSEELLAAIRGHAQAAVE